MTSVEVSIHHRKIIRLYGNFTTLNENLICHEKIRPLL